MPDIVSKTKALEIAMPARGLTTTVPPLYLQPQFVPYVENIRFHRGEALNRPGTIRYPSDGTEEIDGIINGSHLYTLDDNTLYTVIGAGGSISGTDGVYVYNSGTEVWDDITGAASLSGTASDPWVFAEGWESGAGETTLYMTNGVDDIFKWNGSGNIVDVHAIDGNASAARYMTAYAGRIVTAYVIDAGSTHSNRVRFSGENNCDDWTASSDSTAGFVDIVDPAGAITGMRSLAGSNFIFKQNHIVRMTATGFTNPNFVFQTVGDGIGAVGHHTISEVNGVLFFLGSDNVYAYDGSAAPRGIGEPIRAELFDVLNWSRTRQCFSFHHPLFNEWWLFIVRGTESDQGQAAAWPTVAYIYNYAENTWSKADMTATAHLVAQQTSSSMQIDEMDFIIDDWITSIDSGFGAQNQLLPCLTQADVFDQTVVDSIEVGSPAALSMNTSVGYDAVAQGFTVPTGGALVKQVKVKLRQDGTSSGNITCDIQGDSSGRPNNTSETTGAITLDSSTIALSFTEYTFTWTTPTVLAAGSYHIVLDGSGLGDAADVDVGYSVTIPIGAEELSHATGAGPTWGDTAGVMHHYVYEHTHCVVVQLDDTIIGDRGVDYNSVLETFDARLFPGDEAPRNSTINRVIVTVRDKGSATYSCSVSGNGGKTFTSFGTATTPAVTINETTDLIFHGRFTAPYARARISTSDPMAVLKVAFHYQERTEFR